MHPPLLWSSLLAAAWTGNVTSCVYLDVSAKAHTPRQWRCQTCLGSLSTCSIKSHIAIDLYSVVGDRVHQTLTFVGERWCLTTLQLSIDLHPKKIKVGPITLELSSLLHHGSKWDSADLHFMFNLENDPCVQNP